MCCDAGRRTPLSPHPCSDHSAASAPCPPPRLQALHERRVALQPAGQLPGRGAVLAGQLWGRSVGWEVAWVSGLNWAGSALGYSPSY